MSQTMKFKDKWQVGDSLKQFDKYHKAWEYAFVEIESKEMMEAMKQFCY